MPEIKNQSRKIVIIGAGISGSLTAIGLASKGIETTVIERNSVTSNNYQEDGRTTSLTFSSVNFLDQIGLWQELRPYTSCINDIYVFDSNTSNHLHFASRELNSEALGYMVENARLRKILHEYLTKSPKIELKDNTSYSDIYSNNDSTQIILKDGSNINCELAIVAEGKNSWIKSKYFSSFYENDYHQNGLICNISHSKAHNNIAVEHFMPTGVLAFLPLQDPYKSAVVWSLQSGIAKYLIDDKQKFLGHLNYWASSYLGEISFSTELQSYPLTAQMMKHFVHNRLLLVADAAHNIHPLAGQGINQGIKDVEKLTNLVALNKTAGLDYITNSMLENYDNTRFADNLLMLGITDNLGDIFAIKNKLFKTARRLSLDLISNASGFKNNLVKFAMGKRAP